LAAVGASDFGVQSVIFGCLKALTDELRFGLTHKQLANACPSVKTLRNWEFQLAGGCLATVIDRINKDAKILMDRHKKKLEITLVTDHGNREGVDHFVKMIIWSSYTKDGKHVLRHFNLLVDRGGHTTAAAANAIAKSIEALHLDGSFGPQHLGQVSLSPRRGYDLELYSLSSRPSTTRREFGANGGTSRKDTRRGGPEVGAGKDPLHFLP
jgi:hypothetical protein